MSTDPGDTNRFNGLPFAVTMPFVVGKNPSGVALGDFNGDGKLDFAAANSGAADLTVRFGDGRGGFGPSQNFSTGQAPASVMAVDLNRDGFLDLVTANRPEGSVSVLLGEGRGGFGGQTKLIVDDDPLNVIPGDFNGDGWLDLVVTYAQSTGVSLLLSDGRGGFGTARTVTIDDVRGEKAAAVGDWNGDGKLDLAVSMESAIQSVAVLLGDGLGGLGAIASHPVLEDSARWLLAADWNRDGNLDLSTAAGHVWISTLLGHGDGGFDLIPPYPGNAPFRSSAATTDDFNRDGILDIALIDPEDNQIQILLGDGTGHFGIFSDTYGDNYVGWLDGSAPTGIAVGDVNGDGKPDLAVTSANGNAVIVLLNQAP